jgi:hypothetical protein
VGESVHHLFYIVNIDISKSFVYCLVCSSNYNFLLSPFVYIFLISLSERCPVRADVSCLPRTRGDISNTRSIRLHHVIMESCILNSSSTTSGCSIGMGCSSKWRIYTTCCTYINSRIQVFFGVMMDGLAERSGYHLGP